MLNNCNFIGRVGKEPETRYSASGTAITNFSLAVTEKYKGEEKTEWVNCVAFGKLAEIIDEYVTKGMQLFFSGKMQTRKWQDRDGNDRYTTEIVGEKMVMLGGKEKQESGGGGYADPTAGAFDPDDDIPF